MVIIKNKADWWDAVNSSWDDIIFMFQYYMDLSSILCDGGPTIMEELNTLKGSRDDSLFELLDMLCEKMCDDTEVSELLIGDVQDVLLDLSEHSSVLFREEYRHIDKGRGNVIEGLGVNEGLEERRERFKAIMKSGWSKGL